MIFGLFARIYPPAGWFCAALTATGGAGILPWLGFAALNLGSLGLVAWALGGKYQQLAIRQSETLVRSKVSKRRAGKLFVRTPLKALYRREVREIFTSPSYALNCLATSIVFPIIFAAAFLSKSGNVSGLSELIPLLDTFPAPMTVGVFTALFALAGSMNMAVATSVSREGRRHEFFRTLPVPASRILLVKTADGSYVRRDRLAALRRFADGFRSFARLVRLARVPARDAVYPLHVSHRAYSGYRPPEIRVENRNRGHQAKRYGNAFDVRRHGVDRRLRLCVLPAGAGGRCRRSSRTLRFVRLRWPRISCCCGGLQPDPPERICSRKSRTELTFPCEGNAG